MEGKIDSTALSIIETGCAMRLESPTYLERQARLESRSLQQPLWEVGKVGRHVLPIDH